MVSTAQSLDQSYFEREQSFRVGRYVIYSEIAVGGAGSVHVGRVAAPGGFVRAVAVKRLHPSLARDPECVASFLAEARLASRIRHSNVITPIDVVIEKGEPFIVMEYVEGLTLAELMRIARTTTGRLPVEVVATLLVDVLRGLHAVHETIHTSKQRSPIVHRDVAPPNVMVGVDGISRILDFGVATGHSDSAKHDIKGKLGYMAPEQLADEAVDRRADVFAAGVVLWEALTLRRLFRALTESETVMRTLSLEVPTPSSINPDVPATLDQVVLRALARNPEERFRTASDFADAIEQALTLATAREVSKSLMQLGGVVLTRRANLLEEIERSLDDVERLPEEETTGFPANWSMPNRQERVTRRCVRPRKSRKRRSYLRYLPLGLAALAFAFYLVRAPSQANHSQQAKDLDATAQHSAPQTAAALSGDDSSLQTSSEQPESETTSSMPLVDAASLASLPEPQIKPKGSDSSSVQVPRRSARSSKPECDPPFTVDESGIRRIKRACI